MEVLDIRDGPHDGLLVGFETEALLDFNDHVLEEFSVELLCGLFANELKRLYSINFLSKPAKIHSFINVSGLKIFSISFHFSCLFQRLNRKQFLFSVFKNLVISSFMGLVYFSDDNF